jgi:trehalose 6-phosphate phosphatase
MEHFFKQWKSLESLLGAARRLFLFFDFDGTLVPICPHPDDAVLNKEAQARLQALSLRPKTVLGFISGRGLNELESRIRVTKAFYAGNHGYEARGLGETFSVELPNEQRDALGRMTVSFHDIARLVPGVVVQEKKYTVSVHYRLVELKKRSLVSRRVRQAAEDLVESGLIEVKKGKMVFEVCPGTSMDKGRVVSWFLQRQHCDFRRDMVVYVGDDRTDEDAFAALPKGVTVRVGQKQGTTARFYLKDHHEVWGFIERILQQ